MLVSGSVADRASRLVAAGEPLELAGTSPRFVSRGGEKLDAALGRFGVDVNGMVALDAGASTGGFTDCLLRRGAATVLAVDVGYGQLDARLRSDPRVLVIERTNVRHLDDAALQQAGARHLLPVDVVTADLSFISLTAVVPVLAGHVVRPGGRLVLLVKPQFEVGRQAASRGKGVIRDPALWLGALRSVASCLEDSGAVIMDAMRSPITGASGNTEFLLHATAHARPAPADRAIEAIGPATGPRIPGADERLRTAVDEATAAAADARPGSADR